MEVKSEFSVAKWDEGKCGEPAYGMQITRASVVYEVSGMINGELDVEYLMHYTNDSSDDQHNSVASYIGYMIFSGSIDGKAGAFALEDRGEYSPAGPVSKLTIKPDTGTDELTGITGAGRYYAEGDQLCRCQEL